MTNNLIAIEIQRGIAERDARNHKAAFKHFQAACELAPNDARGFLHIANMYFRKADYKTALQLATEALGMNCSKGHRSFGLQIRTFSLLKLGRVREAERTVCEALENEPENASNHRVHGQILWSLGHYERAETAFQTALQITPTVPNSVAMYAVFLRARFRLEEAQHLLEQGAVADSDDKMLLMLRAEIAFRLSQLDKARDLALWILSENAENGRAIKLLQAIRFRQKGLTTLFWKFLEFFQKTPKRGVAILYLMLAVLAGIGVFQFPPEIEVNFAPIVTTRDIFVFFGLVAIFFTILPLLRLIQLDREVLFLVKRERTNLRLRKDY